MSENSVMNPEEQYIRETLEEIGIPVDNMMIRRFIFLYHILTERNKVINLTRITDFRDVVIKHFADSLTINKVLNIREGYSFIDIGCGAGFPGLPIGIAYNGLKINMIDSVGKKINFVNEAISGITRELPYKEGERKRDSLRNSAAMHVRAEELAFEKDHRENYDICVSRAVANMSVLAEYALPFVRVGGKFVAYKGADCSSEVKEAGNAIKILGGEISEMKTLDLFGNERTLVVITKKGRTDKRFPRHAGIPAKNPLV